MSAERSSLSSGNLSQPRLYIWMVNYKSAALIESSLASLASEQVDHVMIWDNASGDMETAKLEELAGTDSRIELFLSPVNLGFGAAMNAIADRSHARDDDLIWILNPDTKLLSGSTDALKDALFAQEVDIVSPLLVFGDVQNPSLWFSGGGIDVRRGMCWHEDYGSKDLSKYSELRRTDFMTGAAPMMRRRIWDRIGGFHDGLFLYWEDVEFSLRARDLNVSQGVHPGCIVWHLEGGSGPSEEGHSTAYYFYNARNRVRVCSQRAGLLSVVFGSGIRETVMSVLRPLLREKVNRWSKTWAALRGTFKGILTWRGLGPRRIAGLIPFVTSSIGLAEVGAATQEENPS